MQKSVALAIATTTTTTYYTRFCNWALTSHTIFHQFHLIVGVAGCFHIHFSRRLYSLSFGFNFCFCTSVLVRLFYRTLLTFVVFFPKCVCECKFIFVSLHFTPHFMIATGFLPPMLLLPAPCACFIYLTFYPHHFWICSFFHTMTVYSMMSHVCGANRKKKSKKMKRRKKLKNRWTTISKFSFVCMSYACIYCVVNW